MTLKDIKDLIEFRNFTDEAYGGIEVKVLTKDRRTLKLEDLRFDYVDGKPALYLIEEGSSPI